MEPDAAWARRSSLQAHVTRMVVVCLQQARAVVIGADDAIQKQVAAGQ